MSIKQYLASAALKHSPKYFPREMSEVGTGTVAWEEAVRSGEAANLPRRRPFSEPCKVSTLPSLRRTLVWGIELRSFLGELVSEFVAPDTLVARGVAWVGVEEVEDELPEDAGITLGRARLSLENG